MAHDTPRDPPPLRVVTTDDDRNIVFDQPLAREPMTPADVLRSFASKPVMHVSTGIEALDAQTSGGPRCGDLVVIQGAPDASKTFFAWAIAEAFADAGVLVAFHAIDEQPEKLATRSMQRRGALRDDVEARRDLDRFLPDLPQIRLFDASFTLEEVISWLARTAGKKPASLFVDSVQKAPSAARTKASGMADQVSAVVAVVNDAAQRYGWPVVVTSEATRGHYASNDPTHALGSARWSADLDFAAKILISLAPNRRQPDDVAISLAKNKCGPQVTFRVRVDRDRQGILPDESPRPTESTVPQSDRAERRSDADRTRVLHIIEAHPGIGTMKLRDEARPLRVDTLNTLLEELSNELLVENRPEMRGTRAFPHWFATPTHPKAEVGP